MAFSFKKLIAPLANCEWNEWGKWGLCSTTCGGGVQTRNRTKKQISQNGGQDCTGQSEDTPRTCNEDVCPSEFFFAYECLIIM